MRQVGTRYLGLLILSLTALFASYSSAEIYKWVDADGKVHFGDKPKDPVQASKAQPVELQESYQPAVRTAQEQEAYDRERALQLKTQTYQREDEAAREKAELERRERKAELCAAYDEDISELETVKIENGIRILTYVEGEDGEAISSERQREIIEELKAQKAKAGCT